MVPNIAGWSIPLDAVTEIQYGGDIDGDGVLSASKKFWVWASTKNANTIGLKFNFSN